MFGRRPATRERAGHQRSAAAREAHRLARQAGESVGATRRSPVPRTPLLARAAQTTTADGLRREISVRRAAIS